MINLVNGETVTVEVITAIVERFDYVDVQQEKAAFDKCCGAVYTETDLNDLITIAKSFSVEAN